MPELERPVDSIEARVGNPTLYTTAYEGILDISVLKWALHALCLRNMVLCGRIYLEENNHILYVTPGNVSLSTKPSQSHNSFLEEIAEPWDPTVQMFSVALHQGNGFGALSLRLDHAIADGSGSVDIFRELWQFYTMAMGGERVSPKTAISLPTPPLELLQKRWNTKCIGKIRSNKPQNNLDNNERRRLSKKFSLGRKSACVHRIQLSEERTNTLRRACRAQSISVNSFVVGSVLIALRNLDSSRGLMKYVCVTPIDLRKRVRPEVGPTETTNLAVNHMAEVSLQGNETPMAVGSEVGNQIQLSISQRRVVVGDFFGHEPSQEKTLRKCLAEGRGIWLTNLGSIESFVQPSEMALTDFRVTVIPGVYAVCTYNGRLSIEYDYSYAQFGALEVENLVGSIRRNLNRITEC